MDATNSPELLRIAQVAERLSVSRSSVYRWLAEGRLPGVQLGGPGSPIRIPANELEQWLYDVRGDVHDPAMRAGRSA